MVASLRTGEPAFGRIAAASSAFGPNRNERTHMNTKRRHGETSRFVVRQRFTPWRAIVLAASALASSAGCSAEAGVDDSEPAAGTIEQEFVVNSDWSNRLISRVNAGSTVRVCLSGEYALNNPTTAQTNITNAIMKWVQGAQQSAVKSLVTAASIKYVSCSSTHDVEVHWINCPDPGWECRASATRGYVRLYHGKTSLGHQRDTFDVILHEFGHVFGLGDTYIEGVNACQPGQPSSVMCQNPVSNNLFADDINAIGEIYCMANPSPSKCKRRAESSTDWCDGDLDRVYVGDFNGDGREDVLCHEHDGGKSIDYASSTGKFGKPNWSSEMGWCVGDGVELMIGDYNGDHHDDMLCHRYSDGYNWVIHADKYGRFSGSGTALGGWCVGATAGFLVGDFNKDGRDDMMCHRPADGYKWIKYADSNGLFSGSTVGIDLKWCVGSDAYLQVGDFNKDGRDDILCHRPTDGYNWINYANSSGSFSGSGTFLGEWCTGYGAGLLVDDFNGDGRDDLICHRTSDGYIWMALANTSNTFTGTSREWPMGWCPSAADRYLRFGDFDGNGAADLFCLDKPQGHRWTAFQYP